MVHKGRQARRIRRLPRAAIPAAVFVTCLSLGAQAFQFDTPPDWQVNWDNTVTYNLGLRARGVDPLIGNNPNFHNSDYKFAHAGDVVTNRASVLTEFNAIYDGSMGLRLSASLWKDAAYGSGVRSNPGTYANAGGGMPAIPYSAITGYPGGRYSGYTDRFYAQGAQLLDAFAFKNFEVGGKPVYLKIGQFTEYWGNALFFPFHSISYGQGAIDAIKLSASPGTDVKELFLPRPQISLMTQLTPEVALSGQYFFGFDRNRLPAGGTFLGPVDFLYQGPSNLFAGAVPSAALGLPAGGFVPLNVPAGTANVPPNRNKNFGVKLGWTPSFMNGGMSLYYRRFDETQPWAPLFNFGPGGVPTSYHMSYNRGVQLVGVSLDTTLGPVSTGFEAAYRRNTALSSAPNPAVANEPEGARGNVVTLVANALVPLSRSPLWQTGSLTAELAYSRLLSVNSNPALYNGIGYGGCTGGKWDGCSTKNHLAIAVRFEPQWLQVFPGVDLSMPISDVYGIYGNPAQLSTGQQGSHNYSIGVKATIRQKATATLAYNGSYSHTSKIAHTPSGLPYYASGNSAFGLNDRNWISLTLQTSF